MSWDDIVDYFEKLEVRDEIARSTNNGQKKEKSKTTNQNKSPEHQKNNGKKHSRKFCANCKMRNHNTVDCTAKGGMKYKGNEHKTPNLNREQLNAVFQYLNAARKDSKKSKKRKVQFSENTKDHAAEFFGNLNHSSDSDSNYSQPTQFSCMHSYSFSLLSKMNKSNKKPKYEHRTTEVIVEIENSAGDVFPIRALLDTGCSATICLKHIVAKGKASRYKDPNPTQ